MKTLDFPAGHSMDTAWFAVDLDGRVAAFESGESGAVPVDAYLGEEALGLLDELRAQGEVRRVAPVPAWNGEPEHRVRPGLGEPAVFFLREATVLAAELASGAARRVPSDGPVAIRVEEADAALIARLHAAGDCLGCEYELDPESPRSAARGLYEYSHACENWVAGPYRLVAKPDRPLQEEDLPGELRGHLVRFEGRFDETPLLQPMTVWPCESWEPGWLDRDGSTVRPVPGREDECREHVAELKSAGEEGLVYEDVAPAKPAGTPAKRRPWWKVW